MATAGKPVSDVRRPPTTRDPTNAARRWEAELPGIRLEPFLLATTINHIGQLVVREFNAMAQAHGVGPGDLRILLALRRYGPDYALSPTNLVQELLVTSGAISKQVDRLVESGLVSRRADPQILRGVLIHLEPAGRRITDQVMHEVATSFCGFEAVSPKKAKGYLDVLHQLQTLIEHAGTRDADLVGSGD